MSVELAVVPRGPYSLTLSARFAGDATRTFRGGALTALLDATGAPELVHAWQSPAAGTVVIRAGSRAGAERMRWLLALDDDHSGFLRRAAGDGLLGRTSRELRGLRPLRVPTVAHALLRAVCGQLVDWQTAKALERRIVRSLSPARMGGLALSPTSAALAALSPARLRGLGLHERRAAALVRVCRTLDPDRLHALSSAEVASRLERERGLGPWSTGVVCLQGLGRFDRGLVGDLGLVKLLRALRGRPVEPHETAELLEPYGEWAGLAGVYLLAGAARGLVPLDDARAA